MATEDETAKAAGDALEQALLKATRVVELELARIMKAGEEDLDRLARRIAETLAGMAIDSALSAPPVGQSPAGSGAEGSINQIAAAVARAARRGARFS